MSESLPPQVWTVAEAKARLSEILRLAEQEGPQHVGVRKSFVVVPAALWRANNAAEKPLGRWLVDNMPRGTNLDARDRASRRARFRSATAGSRERYPPRHQRGLRADQNGARRARHQVHS